jgi:glycosyltransferase 2 family protein
LSLVLQAAQVIQIWLVGLALEVPMPAVYYWILVPVVSLLTLAPVSINGIGVREASTVLLLAPVGVASGTALTLVFLWFAAFTLANLPGLGFYLIGGFPQSGRDAELERTVPRQPSQAAA